MASDGQLRQWRKNRESSRSSLVGGAVFGVSGTLTMILAYALVGNKLPAWVFPVGLLGVWFYYAGDWINIRYLDRRIAEAERDQLAGPP